MGAKMIIQIKEHDGDLCEAIKVVVASMSDVSEQAKVREKEIHTYIENLIVAVTEMLRDREVALISDVEIAEHQKQKELQLQKDELEFLLSGIRHAVLFTETMIKEGSDTEIVTNHQQVVARMSTLTTEREKAQFEPATDSNIEFVEGEEKLSLGLRDLGSVMSRSISTEKFSIQKPTENTHQINQIYSFRVVLADRLGNKAGAKFPHNGIKDLAVEVAGPSKVKVQCFSSLGLAKFVSFIFCPLFLTVGHR